MIIETLKENNSKVVAYYEQTEKTYENWGNSDVYELHYGYRDEPEDDHLTSLMRLNEIVAEEAEIKQGDSILDAGCGVGASSIWLAKNKNAIVNGISLCQAQVEKARNFARSNEIDYLTSFSCQDYTKTTFADESFDVVWGIESICYAQDKRNFLKEAYRILRPGGRVVVADYFLTKDNFSEIEDHCLRKWLEGWVMPNLPSENEFKNWMSSSDFKNVKAKDITENISVSADEIYKRGVAGFPGDLFSKNKNVLQMKHVEACIFQGVCLKKNLWKYQIFTGQKK